MRIVEKMAARNANARENAPVLIACLGDIVTHGCFEAHVDARGEAHSRCNPDEAYVGQLARKLHGYYPMAAVSVLNAGIDGNNAAGGCARLETDVIRREPDLVIVNYGLNDAWGGIEGLEKYRSNMTEIFSRLQAANMECMLLTPNRMCSYVAHDFPTEGYREIARKAALLQNQGVLDAYVQTARKLAKSMNVAIADANRVWNNLEAAGVDTTAMLANRINHPDAAAHGIFVEQILARMFERSENG